MKKDDIELYRNIQKNTQMGMKAMDILANKVSDDDVSLQLSSQGLKYSQLYNKAGNKLLEARAEQYKSNAIEGMLLAGAIHTNTLLDVSNGHLAEMMIDGSHKGITQIWKAMSQHERASEYSVEMAKELVDFEERCIERWKKYL